MAEVADYAVPFSQMTLVDWLDDLTVRFLLNLPAAELSSVPRLCFQVEEAQWFYEDFIRPANPQLPSLNLRQFCMTLFQHCPLLSSFNAAQHLAAYEEFLAYKVRVPVRGAILMDDTMEKALLVRGWKKGASWSFPRGKINKNEKDIDCAVREVYEETGFDIAAAGLVQSNEQEGQVKAIDITMREQHMKLFVFRGVPLDTYFEPKTRKEISKIQWYNVKDLPGYKKNKGGPGYGQGEAQANKFYMVAPFLGHLKRWISEQRKRDIVNAQMQHRRNVSAADAFAADITEDEGDTEAYVVPEFGTGVPATSADELKKLLSIGQDPANTSLPSEQSAMHDETAAHTADLLSMLKGGQQSSYAPAPFISPVHQEPGNTHQYIDTMQTGNMQPHQLHQQQQLLSQFFSPSQLPQHSYPATTPGIPDSSVSYHSRTSAAHTAWQASQSAHLPTTELHQPLMSHPHPPSMPSPGPRNHSSQVATAHTENTQHLSQQYNSFGPNIGGPQVPEASNLPAPRLNAHSMNLLNSFRNASGVNSGLGVSGTYGSSQQVAGSQQKAALLGLFKSASPLQPHQMASSPLMKPPTSPIKATTAVSSSSNRPPNLEERKLTANEITRTLALHPKPEPATPGTLEPSGELPKTFRSNNAQQANFNTPDLQPSPLQTQPPARVTTRTEAQNVPKKKGTLNQPNPAQLSSRQNERGPKTTSISTLSKPLDRQVDVSSEPGSVKVQRENSPSLPQFSILQRPGSSAGKSLRPSAPQSPLRNEARTSIFQPQVLKRPVSGGTSDEVNVSAEDTPKTATGAEKTDQLLALFGKTPASASDPQQAFNSPPKAASQGHAPQRDALLNLFNGSNAPQSVLSSTTTPPPAPQLVPERNPLRSQGNRQQSQQHLLNLFSVQNANNATSPSTPISPFSLSTPIVKGMPGDQQRSGAPGEARSRLGSIASMVSSGTNSGRQTPTPTAATPTEAKGFLMDYLNGVVKEGYRGAKRGGA